MAEKNIECLECHKMFGTLAPHIRFHGMKKADYLAKYGEDTPFGPDWDDYHRRVEQGLVQPKMTKAEKDEAEAQDDDPALSEFTPGEKRAFQKRFDILWAQSEMDEALESSIRDLAINDVLLTRIQKKMLKLSSEKAPNPADLQKYQAIADSLQSKILENLKELNLTRARKQALNKSPETTPSRLITAYKLVLANMTAEERQKEFEDEQDALRRLHENITDLFSLIPAPGTITSNIDDDFLMDAESQ